MTSVRPTGPSRLGLSPQSPPDLSVLSIGKMVAGSEDNYLKTVASGREEYYTGPHRAPGREEDHRFAATSCWSANGCGADPCPFCGVAVRGSGLSSSRPWDRAHRCSLGPAMRVMSPFRRRWPSQATHPERPGG
jgi:hypothetical protein